MEIDWLKEPHSHDINRFFGAVLVGDVKALAAWAGCCCAMLDSMSPSRFLRTLYNPPCKKKTDVAEHQRCLTTSAYSLTGLPGAARVTLYLVVR